MPSQSLFKWRHFLPEIILLNVRWYCRHTLSYRDLEEMMSERGVEVDHSTIHHQRSVRHWMVNADGFSRLTVHCYLHNVR